jgi:hypothetical protein
MGVMLGGALGMIAVLLSACGSSAATSVSPTPSGTASSTPSITPSPSVTPSASATATASFPSPNPSVTVTPPAPKKGAATATCVNGWTEPSSQSDDFFKQALAALQQSQGGSAYAVKSVRYFAGPLAGGGIGAIYYLNVSDPKFNGRVLLVSGGGAAAAAVAPSGTTGWKAGDWKGFRGQTAATAYPPLPGKWSGPEYDAVTGGLLAPSVAGCMIGT